MAGWQLEVFKMTLYMAFPVGLFWYFNQPQFFEEAVTKAMKEHYPPPNPERAVEIQQLAKEQRARAEQREIEAWKDKQASKLQLQSSTF